MINPSSEAAARFWLIPDTEPVIQERSWSPTTTMPQFGETHLWDLAGLGAPTKANRGWGRLYFTRFLPEWNLLARQLAFCMLNPTHALLRNAQIHVPDAPCAPGSLKRLITSLGLLADYAKKENLPCDFKQWLRDDFHSWHDALDSEWHRTCARRLVGRLSTYGAVTHAGSPPTRVWTASQKQALASNPNQPIKTVPIEPQSWIAVLNAALTYVEVFSTDILAAAEKQRDIYSTTSKPEYMTLGLVKDWLQVPTNLVPLHSPSKTGSFRNAESLESTVNFTLLNQLLGGRGEGFTVGHHNPTRVACRAAIMEAVKAGQAAVGGLNVSRHLIDGRPWHDDFSPRTLRTQLGHLRTACYIVVASMSLMRDSEVQEIGRSSIVDYYGAPAVRSVLWKNNPDAPIEHWWVHPVAVKAIEVAEQVSLDDEFIFSSTRLTKDTAGIDAIRAIDQFVAFVNEHGNRMGLKQINDKIRPHKFRRTMAIIVGQQPGAELAMGVILKHASTRAIANALSRGYSRPDAAWAREFETDRADAAAGRYIDEWLSSSNTSRAVAGPGMTEYNEVFDSIQRESHRLPIIGDKSDLRALLLQENPNLRSGPLNFCLGDPLKAACLKGAVKQAHSKVDPLNCTPATCSQSAVTKAQMPIWIAEEKDLRMMLRKPRLSAASKHELGRRLKEVERITKPTDQPSDGSAV